MTVTVQVAPAAIPPPENDTDPAPATGEKVGAPQPLVEAEGVAATTIAPGLVGNVSLKATPVSAELVLLLTSVKVRVEVPPVPTGPENDFAIEGAATTVSVALPGAAFAPALAEVTAPAESELVYALAAAADTLTVTVHEPLAGTVAPESVSVVPPAAALAVPAAQVVAAAGVAVLTRPAG